MQIQWMHVCQDFEHLVVLLMVGASCWQNLILKLWYLPVTCSHVSQETGKKSVWHLPPLNPKGIGSLHHPPFIIPRFRDLCPQGTFGKERGARTTVAPRSLNCIAFLLYANSHISKCINTKTKSFVIHKNIENTVGKPLQTTVSCVKKELEQLY